MAKHDAIAVFNAGSSSVRFSLYRVGATGEPQPLAEGMVDGLGQAPRLSAQGWQGEKLIDSHWNPSASHEDVIADLVAWITAHLGEGKLRAAGHRIVHGGLHYTRPVRVDASVLRDLKALAPLAPLHQPHNVAAIEAIARHLPELPQVACFDTAFHAGMPAVARDYALPRELCQQGLHRYGFHGLSCEYISSELNRLAPGIAAGRVVIAHLGAGASLTAVQAGRSVANSMGFSTLDGLPMASRCGSLDPGLILYLLREQRMDAATLEDLLYRQSGLLGLSGISGDLRTLLASDDPAAAAAVQTLVYRIHRELGSMAAALGGLDALVFTAGIGEHSVRIRAEVCSLAGWLGVQLDEAANLRGQGLISRPDSRVAVWVLPTDEDRVIAGHTWRLLTAH